MKRKKKKMMMKKKMKKKKNGGGGEITYDAVESTSLVAHWFTLSVFCFASTELAEILGGAGDDVCEEEDFDAA